MRKFHLLTLTVAVFAMALIFQCQKKSESDMANSVDIVSAMEKFHTVLRPLQHQAVPNSDFEAIKTNAEKLQNLAQQIQDASLPESLKEHKPQIDEYIGNLLEASQTLNDSVDTISDEEILSKFAAVHDHYEELADEIYTLENME
ncbi:MAG: hypothetical protein MAGBODY4_01297 [Candidatus Marinimicrobia bacterium]|nr:hypothetical protein [Candidatus Neomarinimicrobiota bacterium]